MSLGLSVIGTYFAIGNEKRPPSPKVWLQEVERWLLAACGEQLEMEPEVDDGGGEPTLYALLHPCAAAIEITAPQRGVVRLSAMTSSVGPGYHQFLCSLMDRMAEELGVAWGPEIEGESEDETGYFYGRDRARLEREMLAWLGAVCRVFLEPGGMLEGDITPGEAPPAMAMGMECRFVHDGGVSTPMGPRDRAWFEAVAEDPRRGIDFFAWWEEGESARTLLRRAEAMMWSQVRWVPAASEEDFKIQCRAAELLAAAYERDATLAYPWREWAELMALVEWEGEPRAEVERRAAGEHPSTPLIGYLRGDVVLSLPGPWTIVLPGTLSVGNDDSGEFVASDGTRTVRCSTLSFGEGDERPTMEQILDNPPPMDLERGEKLAPWRIGRLGGIAEVGRVKDGEKGEEYWMMAAMVCTDGELALVSIFYERDEDREWAERTWRSVRFVGEGA